MQSTQRCLVLIAILALPLVASANTLVIDRTVTGVNAQFLGPGFNDEFLTFDTSAVSNVSLANYNSIQWNLFAPAGQQLVLSNNAIGVFNLSYSNGQFDSAAPEPCGFSFQGQGSPPNNTVGPCGVGSNGNFFFLEPDENFFAGDSFTELSFTFAIPASVAAQAPSDFILDSNAHIGFNDLSQTFQPGFLTLQSVPEPGSLVLLGTGLLGLMGITILRKRLA